MQDLPSCQVCKLAGHHCFDIFNAFRQIPTSDVSERLRLGYVLQERGRRE
jgi:hypothetical protein